MSFNGIAAFRPNYGRGPTQDRLICDWCGRLDNADYAGNCNGCGAPKPRGRAIDVTRLADTMRCWVFEAPPRPPPQYDEPFSF